METRLIAGAAVAAALALGLYLADSSDGAAPTAQLEVPAAAAATVPASAGDVPLMRTPPPPAPVAGGEAVAVYVVVLAADDLPLADIGVVLYPRDAAREKREATTNAQGHCVFVVAPGEYDVDVNHSLRLHDDLSRGHCHVVASRDHSPVATVSLARMSATVDVLVTDTLGSPVPNLQVDLGSHYGKATTDSTGAARFTKIAPGRVLVRLGRTVDLSEQVALPRPAVFDEPVADGANTIRLQVHRKGAVRFLISPSLEMFERVSLQVSPIATTSDVQAGVSVSHVDGPTSELLLHLPEGRWRVKPRTDAESWLFCSGAIEFNVASGREVRVPVVLRPELGSLTGTVVDAHGTPVEGITVFANWLEPETGQLLQLKFASTDAYGGYRIRGVPSGPCEFGVDVRRYEAAAFALPAGWGATVRISGPGEYPVTLRDGFTIAGSVTGPRGEEVDSRRLVLELEDATQPPLQAAIAGGRYEFTHVPPGDHRLLVERGNGEFEEFGRADTRTAEVGTRVLRCDLEVPAR